MLQIQLALQVNQVYALQRKWEEIYSNKANKQQE